jgi:hypothetical protein
MTRHLANLTRRVALAAAASAVGLALSACQDMSAGVTPAQPQASVVAPAELPPANGQTVGQGKVRVALLLPSSVSGNGAKISTELRNAALLAMSDTGMNTIQLVIKDTGGEEVKAQDAAAEALRENSSLVLGPVFSTSVSAAATVMRPSGRPMIGFSSDASVAGQGVYLLSFLPRTVVRRIASYAAAHGSGSMVAVLPNGPYGDLALAELKQTLTANGGSLLGVARYDPNPQSIWAAAATLAKPAADANAIFVPEGGQIPVTVARSLEGAGVKLDGKKLLGTGQWATSDLSSPVFEGALYADVDRAAFADFKTRYQAAYGAAPTLNAGLGYDAVTLAAGLVKRLGPNGLTRQAIEAPSGFSGVTGLFRFMPDGTTERSLAIYGISKGQTSIVSPAPTSFSPSSS